MAGGTASKQIERIIRGERGRASDLVAVEYPLTLLVNGEELVTLLCTPEYLDELVAGFLYSEGIVAGVDDIRALRLDMERGTAEVETAGGAGLAKRLYGRRAISSGCGRGTVFYQSLDALRAEAVRSTLRVPAGDILALVRELQDAPVFRATGGTHSAALSAAGSPRILVLREDIGRHNAVDKVTGHALRQGWPVGDKILLTTGRISSEILIKTAALGIPVLVSRSAPTSLALDLAERLGVTVAGFARGGRVNVYSCGERVG